MGTSLRLEHGVKSFICQLRKQAAELAVTTAVKSPTGHQPETGTWSEVLDMLVGLQAAVPPGEQAGVLAVTTAVKRHMGTSLRLQHGLKSLVC